MEQAIAVYNSDELDADEGNGGSNNVGHIVQIRTSDFTETNSLALAEFDLATCMNIGSGVAWAGTSSSSATI